MRMLDIPLLHHLFRCHGYRVPSMSIVNSLYMNQQLTKVFFLTVFICNANIK